MNKVRSIPYFIAISAANVPAAASAYPVFLLSMRNDAPDHRCVRYGKIPRLLAPGSLSYAFFQAGKGATAMQAAFFVSI
uniref:Secreted protein n=1 Tax=Paenibacillus athensensis TaxID=1967502 RepID=A0A4Y8PW64_9BACL